MTLSLRNRLTYGDYDKFYQNVFPGAVNAAGTMVSISGLQQRHAAPEPLQPDRPGDRPRAPAPRAHAPRRRRARPAGDRQLPQHRLLHQRSDRPSPASWCRLRADDRRCRSSSARAPTDADNHGVATVAALYAQDQVTLLAALAGGGRPALRPASTSTSTTTATAPTSRATTACVSPRVGLIFKPVGSGLALRQLQPFLPAARRRAARARSRRPTSALDPEEFTNYELGAKWDSAPGPRLHGGRLPPRPQQRRGAGPADPSRSILVDAQRTDGVELGLSGQLTRGVEP